MSQPVEIPSTEWQRTEILVDASEQVLCACHSQCYLWCICDLGVMRRLHVITHDTLASGAKRLDSVDFALLHLLVGVALDDWHTLATATTVDGVLADRMAVQISNRLNGIRLSIDLALITLHSFLNVATDLTQSRIDTGSADTGVCRILDSSEEIVVLRFEGHRESGVDDATLQMHTKVDLHDIFLLQCHFVAGVRCVVPAQW